MKKIIEKNINIPLTPNFIRISDNSNGSVIPIEDFTEKELKEIGKEWTKELIKKAHIIRANKSLSIKENKNNG